MKFFCMLKTVKFFCMSCEMKSFCMCETTVFNTKCDFRDSEKM